MEHLSALRAVRLDEVDRLSDGVDLLRLLVGDLRSELRLKLHEQLDDVEAVGVEVVGEARLAGDLLGLRIGVLGNDVDDLLFDLGVGHGLLLRKAPWGRFAG